MNILVCNIGFMIDYKGQKQSDRLYGGGKHVEKYKGGHEEYNFNENGNYVYGYVSVCPNIYKKFNAKKVNEDKDSIDDILILWVADGLLIGWYKNATVFRRQQFLEDNSRNYHIIKNDKIINTKDECSYIAKAKKGDATLLPLNSRDFAFPRATDINTVGGIGQKNVWYPDSKKDKVLINSVLSFIKEYKNKKPYISKGKIHKKINVPARIEVELIAIDVVRAFYEKSGYIVETVEKENLGWDLEAIKGARKLLIEVKGRGGDQREVYVTPNEYSKMLSNDHIDDYRICVVNNCFSITKELRIFRHIPKQKKTEWRSNAGESLMFFEINSACLKF